MLGVRLNRRHKVVLFLALMAAGVSALAGRSFAEALGCLLIGVALAWQIGSDSLAVHGAMLVIWVSVATMPTLLNWQVHRKQTLAYRNYIAFANKIAKGEIPTPPPGFVLDAVPAPPPLRLQSMDGRFLLVFVPLAVTESILFVAVVRKGKGRDSA